MAIFWLTAAGILGLDRVVKLLALAGLTTGSRTVVLPGVLEWRLTWNQGMALGLLSGEGVATVVLPVAVVAVGWWFLRRYRPTPFTRTATALIIGGFAGNLLDRLTLGAVLDMVYFPWMPWYICNFADIAICFGVALLAISLLARPKDWQLKSEAKAHEQDHPDRAV